MGLTLIKETGAGLPDANSYADVADGNAYHEGHLYASAWSAALDPQKAAALVMATRLIDGEYQFSGFKALSGQALQWPRLECREPDGDTAAFGASNAARVQTKALILGGNGQIKIVSAVQMVPGDLVPKAVVEATCELARELIVQDRTAAPPGEGLKYQNDGGTQTGYDKADKRPIMPAVVQALLARYGSLIKSKSGSVRLVRA